MLELTSLLLGAGLSFAPPAVEPAPEPAQQALRIVEPESDPEGIEFAPPPPSTPPTEVEPQPIEIAVEPPAPIIEPTVPTGPIMVDGKRPSPGTGRIVLGSVSMAASSMLAIGALAGPGWAEVDRHDAVIAGAVAIPLGIGGITMILSGAKSSRRYADWTSRNQLSPPESGNGLLVMGSLMTLGFASTAAYGAQWAITNPNERGKWAPSLVAGSAAVVGMAVLAAGMLRRSRYATWERSAYVMPGPIALQHGGGVGISGRF